MVDDQPRPRGFIRRIAPPGDIEPARRIAPLTVQAAPEPAVSPRFGAVDPELGSGRTFRYEWETQVEAIQNQVADLTVGSSATISHDQPTPAASWNIAHNLGTEPAVTVVVGGSAVLTEVTYPDDMTAVVVFASPTAGTAYLRG